MPEETLKYKCLSAEEEVAAAAASGGWPDYPLYEEAALTWRLARRRQKCSA